MKKFKILFYSYQHLDFNKGGLQNQIFLTKNSLEKRGHQVIFLNEWLKKKEDIDICHQFSIHPTLFNTFKELKARGNKIIISTVFNGNNNNLFQRLLIIMSKFKIPFNNLIVMIKMIKNSDSLISLGQSETLHLSKFYKHKRIAQIPNGITQNILNYDISKIKKKDYIINVGKICKNKNQLKLIKICKELNIDLYIVGPYSKTESSYVKLCKKEANHKIHFMGYIDNNSEKFIKLLSNAKLFILPSYKEVLPISVFESMALGTPVSCTRESNVSSYLDKHINYCNPNSIKSIKNSIIKFKYKNISNEYVKEIRKNFSWDNIAKQVEEIYFKSIEQEK